MHPFGIHPFYIENGRFISVHIDLNHGAGLFTVGTDAVSFIVLVGFVVLTSTSLLWIAQYRLTLCCLSRSCIRLCFSRCIVTLSASKQCIIMILKNLISHKNKHMQ